MRSIEEAIRFHRQRMLVLYRLADTAAACAAYERNEEDESFWVGVASMIDEVLGFLQRLKVHLPPEVLNADEPTDPPEAEEK
jgi:hypothetical protein